MEAEITYSPHHTKLRLTYKQLLYRLVSSL